MGAAEGEGVRGFVNRCASPVEVAGGGEAGSRNGREVENNLAKADWGRRVDARCRQRAHIMIVAVFERRWC